MNEAVIGGVVTVECYACGWCRQMINARCLVGHLLFEHSDAAGAKRALRRMIRRLAEREK